MKAKNLKTKNLAKPKSHEGKKPKNQKPGPRKKHRKVLGRTTELKKSSKTHQNNTKKEARGNFLSDFRGNFLSANSLKKFPKRRFSKTDLPDFGFRLSYDLPPCSQKIPTNCLTETSKKR